MANGTPRARTNWDLGAQQKWRDKGLVAFDSGIVWLAVVHGGGVKGAVVSGHRDSVLDSGEQAGRVYMLMVGLDSLGGVVRSGSVETSVCSKSSSG